MAITPNKDLINVVVRLVSGSVSRIIGVTDTGYKVEGAAKQIPMDHLVRKGRVLQQLDAEKVKALPKEQTYLMTDGYLHIHTRDAMRRIKKGETVDIPPAAAEWKRMTGKVGTKPPKPVSAKTPKVDPKTDAPKPARTPKPVKPKNENKPSPKPVKPKTETATPAKRVRREPSDSINRVAETAQTLYLVVENARTNAKAWKEFKEVFGRSVYGTPKPDLKDIPNSASSILEKFGAVRVRKALSALSDHFDRRRAELSLPRSLKTFLKDGKMTLNKTQLRAVVEILAPSIPADVMDDVISIYFDGEFTFSKVPPRRFVKKTDGGK